MDTLTLMLAVTLSSGVGITGDAGRTSAGEAPYSFRRALETVHDPDCRDPQAVKSADEFAFAPGCTVKDADLADFLRVSMGVATATGGTDAVTAVIDRSLRDREYEIAVSADGVRLAAAEPRSLRRAYYRLEERMKLRGGPFLRFGTERRRPRFAPRMTHSAWDIDIFPDGYLDRLAHAGFDSIMVFVKDVGVTRGEEHADIADLVRRAKRRGLDTYLYSYLVAFVHPEDPKAEAVFASTYGRLAAAYPEAKGIILVGESCEFPSKDPRTTGKSYHDPRPADEKRPNPGWFPCRDYPDWLNAVKAAIRKEAPAMEVVFWTYNWGWAPERERLRLIGDLPDDVTLMATFEMFESAPRRNGLVTRCDDYSLSFPLPGRYFLSEAAAAKGRGLGFYGMTNTSGLSWDLGCVPYEPFPQLWRERWAAVADAGRELALRGLMENHTYGCTPSFISELENELFTEGGASFEETLRAIAARDFGAENVEAAIAAWAKWSTAAKDMVPRDHNQYGPLRIGPAYPYNFYGRRIRKAEFPATPGRTGVKFCSLNYLERIAYTEDTDGTPRDIDRAEELKEIELFGGMAKAFDEGAAEFERIAANCSWKHRRELAERMAGLGRFWAAAMKTTVNVKRGALAFLDGDREAVQRIGREEYANASAALELAERDSRLGYEPAAGYVAGPEQLRWKLKLMFDVAGDASFVEKPRYDGAEREPWAAVRLAGMPRGKDQLSVHIPVGLPEAADLLYCDCAFNAWKLPVPPDLRTGDLKSRAIVDALRVSFVSFALSETPFAPDFRQTVWTRQAGCPIVRGELDAKYRRYVFEYCTDPDDGELYIRGTVKNTGASRGKAVVRVRRASALERDICDYHYFTFRWDAAKWKTGEERPVAAMENGFDRMEAEGEWSVGDGAYGMEDDFWGAPYYVHPGMRIREGRGTLRFEAELAPEEERSFTIRAGFAAEPSASRRTFDEVVESARRYWDGRLTVRADFGNRRDNDLFRNLQFCNLQLLLNPWKDPRSTCLQPCQGGSSERFYVWVWEAMEALRPMARTGHFEPVRKALEFILRLQDGGCPPKGDFTTLKGAIGTTGPRWANTTGAALLLASDYILYSEDREFRDRHLANLIRAADWILGETRATRKLNADGSPVEAYGLMPGCVVNDGDRGVFFASTDSYSYAGVRHLADLLAELGHPEAARISSESARYRADIEAAIRRVQRPDGFIPRVIGSDKGGSFEFRNIPHALNFLATETVDPATDEPLRRMVDYWERERCDGLFARPFDARIKYIGNSEAVLCRYHLTRGEWKRAYLARQTFLNYALTRDLGIASERYSEVDDGYTPWQPNASNSGRGLALLADRFLAEGASRLVLLGGFAPFENADVSIDGLRTGYGRFSLSRCGGTLTAKWERPLPRGTKVIIPDYLGFRPECADFRQMSVGSWEVLEPLSCLRGTLSSR